MFAFTLIPLMNSKEVLDNTINELNTTISSNEQAIATHSADKINNTDWSSIFIIIGYVVGAIIIIAVLYFVVTKIYTYIVTKKMINRIVLINAQNIILIENNINFFFDKKSELLEIQRFVYEHFERLKNIKVNIFNTETIYDRLINMEKIEHSFNNRMNIMFNK